MATSETTAQTVTASEAREIARDAWVFGLPLVYIGKQIDVSSHVTKPEGPRAPINQFAHYREFPDASNKTVVGLNVDTLYSLASLDLAKEPIVLSIPQMGDRFWLMQIIDAWNDVRPMPQAHVPWAGRAATSRWSGPIGKASFPQAWSNCAFPRTWR